MDQIYSFQSPGVSLVIQCISSVSIVCLFCWDFIFSVSTKPPSLWHNTTWTFYMPTFEKLRYCSFKNVSLCTVLSIHQTKWMHISPDIASFAYYNQTNKIWICDPTILEKFSFSNNTKRGNPNYLWYFFFEILDTTIILYKFHTQRRRCALNEMLQNK